MSAWLSVDTDDLIHLPSKRGDPYRSSIPMPTWNTQGYKASKELLEATDSFIQWVENGPKVTIFLIAEQLDCPEFSMRLQKLVQMPNITFACHGWGHRCWSAWPENAKDFSDMLVASRDRISAFAGQSWRPWFRAPGGYVAPWMSGPLAATGFRLDSSVNPSRWVLKKMLGDWRRVISAMEQSGVIERPWLTTFLGPACGPALSLIPFSWFAKRAWKNHSTEITDNPESSEVTTLYWHILDHRRKSGKWIPPLAKSK